MTYFKFVGEQNGLVNDFCQLVLEKEMNLMVKYYMDDVQIPCSVPTLPTLEICLIDPIPEKDPEAMEKFLSCMRHSAVWEINEQRTILSCPISKLGFWDKVKDEPLKIQGALSAVLTELKMYLELLK